MIVGNSITQITNEFAKLFYEKTASKITLYVGPPVQEEIEDKDKISHIIPPRQEHIWLFNEFRNHADNLIDFLSIEDVKRSSERYDLIVADLPFGMPPKPWKNKIKVDESWVHISDLMELVKDSGYGLFSVSPGFWFGKGNQFREILSNSNINVQAVIDPPKGILSPMTMIQPCLIILSKTDSGNLFVAQNSNMDGTENIIDNFLNNVSTNHIEQGMTLKRDEFKGFENFFIQREIENIQSGFKGYKEYRLIDVAEEINVGKHNVEFVEKENAIYLPNIGKSKVHFDLSQITLKSQNYFQIVLKSSLVINRYAALFYKSSLGMAIRKILTRGTIIPKINKAIISEEAIIAVPSMEEQVIISDASDKIDLIQNEIEILSNELSINPQNAHNLQNKLDDVLNEFSLLTRSDAIKAIIRKREGVTREFKETLSLDINKNTKEKYMEHMVLKTIVAFLNTEGGDILVGISDDYKIRGLGKEISLFHKDNHDKFLLHFKNLFRRSIGEEFYPFVDYRLQNVDGVQILHVECKRSDFPCYCDGKLFYVRTNPATDLLEGPKLVQYINTHFEN